MTGTGLLGGSFNPAHRGHSQMTAAAMRALSLDEIWWLVSPGNPLKPTGDMAGLAERFASARQAARGLRVRVTAIERAFGTHYTIDTIRALQRRFPARRFIWLMGADNLAQLHRWKDWRGIAALVPIAVVGRPGYDARARMAPAMGWLRRFVRPARQAKRWTKWRTPALVLLTLPPDPTSATGIRAADPNWRRRFDPPRFSRALRDGVTRRLL